MNNGARENFAVMAVARMEGEINRVHVEANAFLAQMIRRDFPEHEGLVRVVDREILYDFKVHRTVANATVPAVNMSTRVIRNDLFERDEG